MNGTASNKQTADQHWLPRTIPAAPDQVGSALQGCSNRGLGRPLIPWEPELSWPNMVKSSFCYDTWI
ncbi:hypothetical protein RSAG8_03609, partial [Rhizoctonia solani AG-8 WAC10335]